MTFNTRIIAWSDDQWPTGYRYQVHEVYYDEEDRPICYTGVKELCVEDERDIAFINRMISDAHNKPIIDGDNFPNEFDIDDDSPLKVLDNYEEDDSLDTFHILHMYDTGLRCKDYNDGFEDSRHFNVYIYNLKSMKKRFLGKHDAIDTKTESKVINKIFYDGSTMMSYFKDMRFENTQLLYIRDE